MFKKNSKTGRPTPRIAWDQIYIARSKGCPPLGPNRKHPRPLTGWRALIQGHGTLITAPLFGVYKERGLQLTKPHSLQKTCGSTERERTGTRLDPRQYWS